MTPRMVANILHSLVRLRLRPNSRFVHGLLASLQPLIAAQRAGSADLVQLAIALPALKHGLPPDMVPDFQRLVDAKLQKLKNPEAKAMAVRGWSELGLQVRDGLHAESVLD